LEKLLARRNDLVREFDLTDEGVALEPCNPNMTARVQTSDGVEMPVIRGMINLLSRLFRQDEAHGTRKGCRCLVSDSSIIVRNMLYIIACI